MSRDGSGDFAIGFLVGTFVGAVLAVLFTPVSGDEMRGRIREGSIELKERATEFSEDATKKAEELKTKGESLLHEQRERFEEAIEEGKQAASRKKSELIAQLEAAKSSSSEASDKSA
jgi:gas vesicle protein